MPLEESLDSARPFAENVMPPFTERGDFITRGTRVMKSIARSIGAGVALPAAASLRRPERAIGAAWR